MDLHLSLVEPLLPSLAEDMRQTTHRLHLPPVSRFGAAVQGQLAIAWTARIHYEMGDDAPLTTASGWGGDVPLPPGGADLVLTGADGGRGIVLQTGRGAGVVFNGVGCGHGTGFRWGLEGEEEDFLAALKEIARAKERLEGREEEKFGDIAEELLGLNLLDIEEDEPAPASTSSSHNSPSPPTRADVSTAQLSSSSGDASAPTNDGGLASWSDDLTGIEWADEKEFNLLKEPLGSRRLEGPERDRGICIFMKERVERRQERKAAQMGENMPLGFAGGGRFSGVGYLDPTAPTDRRILSRHDYLAQLASTSSSTASPSPLISAFDSLLPSAPLIPLLSRNPNGSSTSTAFPAGTAPAPAISRVGSLVAMSGDREADARGTGAATDIMGEMNRRLTRQMTKAMPDAVKASMVDLAGQAVW